uniref:Dynactin subunit 1 n=1 Tax=Lygus hesperus TaxID=30085 RepID=A0A0A9WBU5_LYGHE
MTTTVKRASSVSGMTAQGGPPLPRRGPGARLPSQPPSLSPARAAVAYGGMTTASPFVAPAHIPLLRQAIPPPNFTSQQPSRMSMSSAMTHIPIGTTMQDNRQDCVQNTGFDRSKNNNTNNSRQINATSASGAFLALPRE